MNKYEVTKVEGDNLRAQVSVGDFMWDRAPADAPIGETRIWIVRNLKTGRETGRIEATDLGPQPDEPVGNLDDSDE